MSSFWDASAALALCTHQRKSAAVRLLLRANNPLVVWWGTPMEIRSAFARLFREGTISRTGLDQGMAQLATLRRYWHEVLPSDHLRDMAEALLDAHVLGTADALQLSAALVWSRASPRGRAFVCGDLQLATAAEHLGFSVLRPEAMSGSKLQAARSHRGSPEDAAWAPPLPL